MSTPPSPADDLLTVRDWLRYAVSRFNEAKLVYGHGTDSALDQAAVEGQTAIEKEAAGGR